MAKPSFLVVMGVAGCGKSTVGRAVADALGLPMIEGDEFHAAASVVKMKAGIALDDADRAGWLDTLAAQWAAHPAGAVLACSALKRTYRDRLRAPVPGVRFAYLALSRDEALRRVAARAGEHLFPPSLVASQYAALEAPIGEPGVLELDAARPIGGLTQRCVEWLQGTAHE